MNVTSIPNPSVQNATCDLDVTSYHSFLVVIYSLLFLVGLGLNSFTLWFHCCVPHGQMSKSWMIYLKHLTAADFLLCITIPLRIVHYARSSFPILLVYCSIGVPLFFLNWAASILFMGYIAANRYMKILYSPGSHFLMSAKASRIISTTTWVVLLGMTAPYAIMMLVNANHDNEHTMCDHLIRETVKPLYTVIHAFSFIIFLSGLFSLVFCYYSTSRRVLQVQQAQLASSSKKLMKSRRNMLVLVCVFCFCFVPNQVVQFLSLILGGNCSVELYLVKEMFILLSVCNICLDPLIYVFLCKEFRAQLNLKKIFCIKWKRNTSSLEARNSENQLNTISTINTIIMSALQGQREQ